MVFLVVGDANADLNAALEHFPCEGDDALVHGLAWGSGGAAANVATALGLLGARARLIARVGADPAAEVALRAAREAGVDLDAVQRDEARSTGLCFVAVSPGGERTFFSHRGANVALSLPDAEAVFCGVRWLHVGGHALLEGRQRETTLAWIVEASRRRIPASIDLCLPLLRADPKLVFELAPRLDVVFANELELAAVAEEDLKGAELGSARQAFPPEGRGTSDPVHLATAALERRGARFVAAKLGARGSRVGGHDIAPFPVEVRDTTCAGDAYVAGFLFAFARGAPPEVAGRLGGALGALTVTRPGAAEALPTLAEVRAFLAARDAARDAARELHVLSPEPHSSRDD